MDKLEFLRNQIHARDEAIALHEEKLNHIAELEKQLCELKNEVANCNCDNLKAEIDTLKEIALQLDPNFIN